MAHLLVNRKQVTVGTIGGDYELFSRQPGPTEVEDAIYCKVIWPEVHKKLSYRMQEDKINPYAFKRTNEIL